MMKEEANTRYLVRSYEPSDWIRHVEEGTQAVNDFYLPGTVPGDQYAAGDPEQEHDPQSLSGTI